MYFSKLGLFLCRWLKGKLQVKQLVHYVISCSTCVFGWRNPKTATSWRELISLLHATSNTIILFINTYMHNFFLIIYVHAYCLYWFCRCYTRWSKFYSNSLYHKYNVILQSDNSWNVARNKTFVVYIQENDFSNSLLHEKLTFFFLYTNKYISFFLPALLVCLPLLGIQFFIVFLCVEYWRFSLGWKGAHYLIFSCNY